MESQAKKIDTTAIKTWLVNDVTLKLPGWAFAVGAVGALILLVAALD